LKWGVSKMKRFIITIFIILLIVSCQDNPSESELQSVRGYWTGTYAHCYPGPDDEPIVDAGNLCILFTNSEVSYNLEECSDSISAPWQATGTYNQDDQTLHFSNVTRERDDPELILYGEFEITFDDQTLTLEKRRGDTFQDICTIELDRYHLIMLDDNSSN
jgi:hypothetical protein